MKNPCKLILAALLFSFLLPIAPALAQDSMTLTITPPLIKVNMLPGEVFSSTIKVVNNNREPVKLYTNVLDFKSGPEGGVEFLQDVYNNEPDPELYKNYRLSQWVEISEGPFELDAQQSMQVPFKIDLPEDAEPGGHYAAILIGTKPEAETSGSAIKVSSLLASLIMVNIKGEIVERGSIREFSTDKKYYRKADIDLAVRFENTGNVHLQPQGKINIYDMFNNLRESININYATDFGNVLPESIRRWDFNWKSDRGLLDTGKYKAMLILTYGEEARETVNQTLEFWVVDYYYLGAVAGGILFLIILIMLLMRFYIRRAIRTTQKEAGYIMPADETKKGGTSVIPKSANGIDLRASVKKKPPVKKEAPATLSGWAVLKRYLVLSLILVVVIAGAVFYLTRRGGDKEAANNKEIDESTETTGGFTVLPPDENEPEEAAGASVEIMEETASTTMAETESMASSTETASSTEEAGESDGDGDVKYAFDSISVTVLNGSGVAGAAGKAKDLLEDGGFTVTSTGNADNFSYSDSVIRYNKKYEREAEYMTGLIDGMVEMEAAAADSDVITVVVGKNFN